MVRWTKKDNKDIYAPSRDLLVTPPISRVNPGETQILRVGLIRDPANPNQEPCTAFMYHDTSPPQPPATGALGHRRE